MFMLKVGDDIEYIYIYQIPESIQSHKEEKRMEWFDPLIPQNCRRKQAAVVV